MTAEQANHPITGRVRKQQLRSIFFSPNDTGYEERFLEGSESSYGEHFNFHHSQLGGTSQHHNQDLLLYLLNITSSKTTRLAINRS